MEEKIAKGIVIGNDHQLSVTIKSEYWDHFPPKSFVKMYSETTGDYLIREVIELGDGKQRVVTIPKQNRSFFPKGTKVKIMAIEEAKEEEELK